MHSVAALGMRMTAAGAAVPVCCRPRSAPLLCRRSTSPTQRGCCPSALASRWAGLGRPGWLGCTQMWGLNVCTKQPARGHVLPQSTVASARPCTAAGVGP